MKYVLERLTSPEVEPIALADMKIHLRVQSGVTTDDDLITSLIQAGREWLEHRTGRALIDQQWRQTIGNYGSRFANVDSDTVAGYYYRGYLDDRGDGTILLRRSPVLAVVSVKTIATDGTLTTIDPSTYEVREPDSKWPRLVTLSGNGFGGTAMRIDFRAGWADRDVSPQETGAVAPATLLAALRLWVEAHYDRDERMMGKLIAAAEALLQPERADLSVA